MIHLLARKTIFHCSCNCNHCKKCVCIIVHTDTVVPSDSDWTSHGSCLIRFEQPTKFPGHSGCSSCSRFGSLIALSSQSQSVNRLIIDYRTAVPFIKLSVGRTMDRWRPVQLSRNVYSNFYCDFQLLIKFHHCLITFFTFTCTYIQLKPEQSMYSTHSSIQWARFVFSSTGVFVSQETTQEDDAQFEL